MRAGDTFLASNPALENHLWVVISNPDADPDRVLCVSLTTAAAHKEDACLVQPGEHPWVTHLTCVAYDKAKAVRLDDLFRLKDSGTIVKKDPVSPELLQRIREKSLDSIDLPMEFADLLADQGLIDL
ncbi:MAG: hypothetical protein U0746_02740 [Gemmataceae bacterium]